MATANRFFRMTDVSFFANRFPDKGRWNTISEAMFPELEENYEDFAAGASPVEIEVETHIKKLTAGLKLKGTDAEIEGLFAQRDTFTFYGAVVDVRTGEEIRRTVTCNGRMGAAKPEGFEKGKLHGYEYGIHSILAYNVTQGDKVIMNWDFEDPGGLVIGGRPLRRDRAITLNLA